MELTGPQNRIKDIFEKKVSDAIKLIEEDFKNFNSEFINMSLNDEDSRNYERILLYEDLEYETIREICSRYEKIGWDLVVGESSYSRGTTIFKFYHKNSDNQR